MLEPYFNIQFCMEMYKNKVGSFSNLSPVLFVFALGNGAWFPIALCSACGWKPDKLKVFALVHVGEGRWACVEPLYEVDLSLVLPCPRGFDGPPFPTERHVPAFVLGVLKGRVIVFQHNLWEDALPAPTVGLEKSKDRFSNHQPSNLDQIWCYDLMVYTHTHTHSHLFIAAKCCLTKHFPQNPGQKF